MRDLKYFYTKLLKKEKYTLLYSIYRKFKKTQIMFLLQNYENITIMTVTFDVYK